MYTIYADTVETANTLEEAKEICWFAGQGVVEDENGNAIYQYNESDVPDYVRGIVADES